MMMMSYDWPAETEQLADILHCHQDRADKLNLKAISQEFVCASDQRSKLFLEITWNRPKLQSQLCGDFAISN